MRSEAMETDVAGPRLVAPELVERRDDRLHLRGGACRACGALSFPKADVCAECLSLDIESKALSSEGVLYAWSRVHMAPAHWNTPYALGYVDLPEGLRVLAHLDETQGAPRIGARMHLAEGRVGVASDGAVLTTYMFSPISGAAA